MAKGNLFLGQAKGKVGSIVLSRAFGKQIARTKPTSVKNPKTIGQNTQRAILATIAKSAAALTPLVDHSFTNVKYGAESVRHFRKINMGILRDLYLNTQNGANLVAKGGSFVPNALKISEGSLPKFISVVNSGDVAFLQDAGKTLPSEGDITVSRFLQAYPYLQGGDQITLVKIIRVNKDDLLSGNALFTIALDRIVFSPSAFNNPDAVIISGNTGVINTNFLDLTRTTNPKCVSLNTEGGLGFSADNQEYYAALILSRKVNNVWQRSAQSLEQIEFSDHTDNDAAIASYGASASVVDATEYLNQAEEGDAVSGMSGAYMGMSVKVGDDVARTFTVNAGSVEDETLQGAAGTIIAISAQAFAPSGKRVITVEIDRPDGSYAAHGATSLNYNVAIAEGTAGLWKVVALYDDGTKAEYHATLAVKG